MSSSLADVQHAATHGVLLLAEHARLRMRQRNVKIGDLKSALRSGAKDCPQDRGAIMVSGGADLAGDALVVVVRLVRLGLLVVTIF